MPDPEDILLRWRLVLGNPAERSLPCQGGDPQAMDGALEWLYGRDPDLDERGIKGHGGTDHRGGTDDPSSISTPDWINEVHRLFPKETIERLERDAVERYQIHDVVTNPDVLARIEPSESLLRAVLHTKHLMNPEVLAMARRIIDKVVRDLMQKLEREVRAALGGSRDRRRSSALKVAHNFDFRRTIRDNLRRYSQKERRLLIERAYFFARTKRFTERWQLILLVDQSGSMVSSVIHSAVTAACLWGLPGIRTHLVAFDTEVVDLTEDVADPVELLMKVQLGGGTYIDKAVQYASELIEFPRRSIVVVISDFYEGGDAFQLVRTVKALVGQGTKVLGLAALDAEANPTYDHDLAGRLVEAGARIGAMTPGQLAGWIAEQINR